jgi:hypothetical protein
MTEVPPLSPLIFPFSASNPFSSFLHDLTEAASSAGPRAGAWSSQWRSASSARGCRRHRNAVAGWLLAVSGPCRGPRSRQRGAGPPLHPRWIRGRRPRRRDAARRTAALRGTAGQACEEDGSGARDDAATCTVHKAFPVRLWLPTSPSPGALSLSLWRATRSGGGWGVGDDGRRCVVA